MKIRCTTRFDITETGVTGHFPSHRVPFVDRAGQAVTDLVTWNRSRNQQRNWETITQLLSLRTQIDWTSPVSDGSWWSFEFSSDNPHVFDHDGDQLGRLRQDCQGVPMLINLGESAGTDPVLQSQGPAPNILFDAVPINN